MMLYVDREIRPKGNTSVQYEIIDEKNIMVGTVRIDFHKGKGIWSYRKMNGQKIRSRNTRGRMSKAVNHYMDHQYDNEPSR